MHNAFQANKVSDEFTLSDIVQLLVVFLQCCYVIGMRILAIKLMDPYGADLEDLSVMTYVRTGWKSSSKLLNSKFLDETESPTEQYIAAEALEA
jgi:hypothetical protein